MIRTALAVSVAVVVLAAISALSLSGLGEWDGAAADDHRRSLSAEVVARKASNGTIVFCVEVGDSRERICPQRRRLRFADAPDGRWLTSEWFFIAPEGSLRIRARRLGERLEFDLQLRADGTQTTLQPRRRFLNWPTTPINQWLRSSTVTIELPAEAHWELGGQGMAPWAARLELNAPAPEFRLPQLGGEHQLISLSDARRSGQPTLILFWSSWSPYASETFAELAALAAGGNVRVVAVNVYEESKGAAISLAERVGVGMTHLADADGSVARHYRVDGLPELFVVDALGVYRGVIRGAAPLGEVLALEYGIE